jgi:DUF4097 and DUF4098 domain-containing protein YvlB
VKNLILLFAILATISPTSVLAASCSATKTINEELSLQGISLLRVNALAGYLEIRPSTDKSVHFSGRSCSDEEEWLQHMTVDVERSDQVLELTVIIPYDDADFDASYAYMDIDLEIPENLPTEIRDSSGDINTEQVSITSIDDSSGNIRVRDNNTSLTIKDSSGRIEVRELRGDLEIADSSGDIDVFDIKGNVTIPRDSSGDIDIETVTGTVVVGRDGSGDIDIQDVKLNVEIGSDGSGSIKVLEVEGAVTIGSDGSGTISIANISGDLLIEAKGSGNVYTRGVKGEISLPR